MPSDHWKQQSVSVEAAPTARKTAESGSPSYFEPSSLAWARKILNRLEGRKGRRPLPDMAHSALLLVDLQRLFVDPDSPAFLPSWPKANPTVQTLLAAARRHHLPVYWSQHLHPRSDSGGTIAHFFGHLIRDDSPWADLAPGLDIRPEDRVLAKARHPAFFGTALAEDLAKRGRDTLVLLGVQAPLCVTATAVWAGALDILPVVVADGLAAKQEDEHEAALVTLASGLAHVVTSTELLEAWDRSFKSDATTTESRHPTNRTRYE